VNAPRFRHLRDDDKLAVVVRPNRLSVAKPFSSPAVLAELREDFAGDVVAELSAGEIREAARNGKRTVKPVTLAGVSVDWVAACDAAERVNGFLVPDGGAQ